jgi:hypothetical protein
MSDGKLELFISLLLGAGRAGISSQAEAVPESAEMYQ